ncbi:MAG: hypothetical protein R6V86_08890 [Spirochaetia bacterium]
MELLDNVNSLLGDNLKKEIVCSTKLKIADSCLSNYAYEALKEELEQRDFEVFFVDQTTLAACFANDEVRINVEQIFKQLSPQTEVKVI